MVNENHMGNHGGPDLSGSTDCMEANPLRRWRKANGLSVGDCVADAPFSAVSWYQWEAWPQGQNVRFPSQSAWVFIRALTADAVTPNDFSDLLRMDAA